MTEDARLCCVALDAGYENKPVLSGISLALHSGELSAIIGPNGSGKSTLLHCLSGILHPMSGDILLDNASLPLLSPKKRARRIAVLPQRLTAYPGLTAFDLALMGRYPHAGSHGFFSRADHAAAWRALEAMRAATLAHRSLEALSGGELQRVFLARSLAQEADILLLDEPAGALDPARSADLFTLLRDLASSGTCVAAVLHDLNAAALYCHRVAALKHGQLMFDIPAHSLTSQHLSELYDTPFHALAHPVTGAPQFCPAAPLPFCDRSHSPCPPLC